MEPFQLCVALGPLAIYLLILGLVNLRRRPLVVPAWRELIAIALALSGFVLVGPMRLFMPEHAAVKFGPLIWVLLVAFYVLCFTLAILMSRPRLIVYNLRADRLQPVLLDIARRLDPTAAWAGQSMSLPALGVEFYLDDFLSMRNVALVATGESQNASAWRLLERELRAALRSVETTPNPRAASLLFAGGLLLTAIVYQLGSDPQAVAQGFSELLQF